MPKNCLTLTLLALLASSPAALPADATLVPFEAVYGIRILIVRGESEVSLREDGDGHYVYAALTEPKGFIGAFVRGEIRETSRFGVHDGRIVPLRYDRIDTISAEERDMSLDFDWERGVATRRVGDTEEQLQLTPGMIDPGLLAIVLMHDLANGRAPGPYTLIERDHLEPVTPIREAEEVLATRAGQYRTIRFAHMAPDTGRTTRLWAAQQLDYMMVQMAQFSDEKTRATLTLKRIERSPPAH